MRVSGYNMSGFRKSGFTLLELLIATAMFAILMGAISSVFYGAVRMRENRYEAIERDLPRSYMLSTVRRDMENCVAPSGLLLGALTGEKEEERDQRLDTLEFYSTTGRIGDGEPWGDIQKIKYAIIYSETSENQEGMDLVRYTTRNLLVIVEEEPEEQVLLNGVESLEFSYYDGEEWQESWDSTDLDDMPQAIMLIAEFVQPDKDKRTIPAFELIVPIVVKALETEESGQTQEEAGGSGGGRGTPQ
jgi:general secretion pathway protein J